MKITLAFNMVTCYNILVTFIYAGGKIMAIIYQHDKRSNITYVYDSKSYYDKEKKTTRAKRTLIGRVDLATGEIVPTDGRCRKDKVKKESDENLEYKELYEKLQNKLKSQESLIATLQNEISKLKGNK